MIGEGEMDPQKFAESVLNDIEVALSEAWRHVEVWDYDSLRRAMRDISEHVENWGLK